MGSIGYPSNFNTYGSLPRFFTSDKVQGEKDNFLLTHVFMLSSFLKLAVLSEKND